MEDSSMSGQLLLIAHHLCALPELANEQDAEHGKVEEDQEGEKPRQALSGDLPNRSENEISRNRVFTLSLSYLTPQAWLWRSPDTNRRLGLRGWLELDW
jgi:hypothetical protein